MPTAGLRLSGLLRIRPQPHPLLPATVYSQVPQTYFLGGAFALNTHIKPNHTEKCNL